MPIAPHLNDFNNAQTTDDISSYLLYCIFDNMRLVKHIEVLVQDCNNLIANVLELLQSSTKTLICTYLQPSLSVWWRYGHIHHLYLLFDDDLVIYIPSAISTCCLTGPVWRWSGHMHTLNHLYLLFDDDLVINIYSTISLCCLTMIWSYTYPQPSLPAVWRWSDHIHTLNHLYLLFGDDLVIYIPSTIYFCCSTVWRWSGYIHTLNYLYLLFDDDLVINIHSTIFPCCLTMIWSNTYPQPSISAIWRWSGRIHTLNHLYLLLDNYLVINIPSTIFICRLTMMWSYTYPQLSLPAVWRWSGHKHTLNNLSLRFDDDLVTYIPSTNSICCLTMIWSICERYSSPGGHPRGTSGLCNQFAVSDIIRCCYICWIQLYLSFTGRLRYLVSSKHVESMSCQHIRA